MTALMLLGTVLDATNPLLFGHLIDAVSSGDRARSNTAALLALGAGTLLALFRFLSSYLLVGSTIQVMRAMVKDGFQRVQRFSTDWHASTFTGSTVRHITRGVWGYDVLATTLILGLFPAFVLLLSVILILACHWMAMGIAVALGVVAYLIVTIVMTSRYFAPAAQHSNRFDSKLSGVLADAIACNALVKSFAAEVREEQRLASTIARWQKLAKITWVRYYVTSLSQSGVSLGLQAGILSIVLWLWGNHRATPGDVAYVLTTFTILQGYLREFSNHFRNLLRSISDLEELANLAQLPLGVVDVPNARSFTVTAGRIVFDKVKFRYPGAERPLYRDLSLDIPAGCKIGLVGASGSGKSTFIKLLQRLFDLEEGRILIDGQDIARVTQVSLRAGVAVVPQDPILFHRSLAENIAYGRPGVDHAQIVAAAQRAHAHDFIIKLPQGYDTVVGERGVKLSGGERQRVALARAVLSDARILILDEATSSLDSLSEDLLQKAVEEVTQGRTTIVTAHRLSTVQRVDRILLFDGGRIVEEGSHRQLAIKPNGHYRRLFETQVLGLIGEERETTASQAGISAANRPA